MQYLMSGYQGLMQSCLHHSIQNGIVMQEKSISRTKRLDSKPQVNLAVAHSIGHNIAPCVPGPLDYLFQQSLELAGGQTRVMSVVL